MIFVLDTNQICHQMWHMAATKAREEARTRGEADWKDAMPDLADVLDWFLSRLENLKGYAIQMHARHGEQPLRLIAAFDGVGQLWRHVDMPEYKGNRTGERIPEIYESVDDAKAALLNADDWYGVTSPAGYEADDVIASIAHQTSDTVIIHSSDKDLNQCLVRGRVGIIKRSEMTDSGLNQNGIPIGAEMVCRHYNCNDCEEEHGFPIARWVDYQALVGDSADNVKGAHGIGHKTACRILHGNAYTPLEALDPADLDLNKRQADGWPDFIERLPQLRSVLTLETGLEVPTEVYS